jgi:hypothetical protein
MVPETAVAHRPTQKPAAPPPQQRTHRKMIVEGRGGQVELLENSVRITRRGFLGWGKPEVKILISKITAIDFKPAGWLGKAGYIRFAYAGAAELKKGRFDDPVSSAASDENSVLFGEGKQPEFEQLKRAVEERMAKLAQQEPQLSRSPSVADELAKLAELRSKGIITDEEFHEQKRRLLQ